MSVLGVDDARSGSEPKAVRFALSLLSACALALALYPTMRVVHALTTIEPDPAKVIWSEHAGFFWRAWTAGYVGVMGGFGAWMASERHSPRISSLLVWFLPTATALLVVQSLFVP